MTGTVAGATDAALLVRAICQEAPGHPFAPRVWNECGVGIAFGVGTCANAVVGTTSSTAIQVVCHAIPGGASTSWDAQCTFHAW